MDLLASRQPVLRDWLYPRSKIIGKSDPKIYPASTNAASGRWPLARRTAKSQKQKKTAKDAKSAKKPESQIVCFFVSADIFLGDLGVLGGSKKDFAILLGRLP